MKITTVLFDLDGTLLPMDQEVFVTDYLKRLAVYMAQYGYDPKAVSETVMHGVFTMVCNDGGKTNETVFWDVFKARFGENSIKDLPKFEEFYRTEFQKLAKLCGCNEKAKQVIELVRAKGMKAVLATNPLFPQIATYSRIRWAGLEPESFEYISTYENSSLCKPNPEYYKDILRRLGLSADECVMVGNDTKEDIVPAAFGMQVFMLKDCLIDKGVDISNYPQGGFDELLDFLENLNKE